MGHARDGVPDVGKQERIENITRTYSDPPQLSGSLSPTGRHYYYFSLSAVLIGI
jgi:hypothetical protein